MLIKTSLSRLHKYLKFHTFFSKHLALRTLCLRNVLHTSVPSTSILNLTNLSRRRQIVHVHIWTSSQEVVTYDVTILYRFFKTFIQKNAAIFILEILLLKKPGHGQCLSSVSGRRFNTDSDCSQER